MNPKPKILIAVVDDHPVCSEGLKMYFNQYEDIEFFGAFPDGEELITAVTKEPITKIPHIVLMDIRLPGKDGVEITKELLATHPTIKVVAFTMCAEEYTAQRMFKAGAHGYLTKGNHPKEIRNVVDCLQQNKKYISPDMAQKFAHHSIDNRELSDISINSVYSEREIGMLRLLADDKSNKEIALFFAVSERTIEVEKSNLGKKLGVTKSAAMVAVAFKLGLLP